MGKRYQLAKRRKIRSRKALTTEMSTNFDLYQWIVRLCISIIGVSLGILLLIKDKHSKKWLAIVQIALAIIVPVCTGVYIYLRKENGLVLCSDIEQIQYEIRMIQYGNIAPIVFLTLYSMFLINTAIVIKKLVSTKTV